MYDRYMLSQDVEDLAEWFDATQENKQAFEPNYNAAPADRMPIVREDGSRRRTIERYRWGLLPYWATGEAAHSTIYARAETLADKSTFKPYFTNRRCLVPAGGFYQWKKDRNGRIPYLIRPVSDPIFAMAGLYSIWEAATGETTSTYCIITTVANKKMEILNDRMPAILPKKFWDSWLDPSNQDTDNLRKWLVPIPEDTLDYYRVSEDVKYASYNRPELIEPVQGQK